MECAFAQLPKNAYNCSTSGSHSTTVDDVSTPASTTKHFPTTSAQRKSLTKSWEVANIAIEKKNNKIAKIV